MRIQHRVQKCVKCFCIQARIQSDDAVHIVATRILSLLLLLLSECSYSADEAIDEKFTLLRLLELLVSSGKVRDTCTYPKQQYFERQESDCGNAIVGSSTRRIPQSLLHPTLSPVQEQQTQQQQIGGRNVRISMDKCLLCSCCYELPLTKHSLNATIKRHAHIVPLLVLNIEGRC